MRDRLSWCAGIKNGIRIVEPNDNLATAYLKKAEEAMEAMHSVTSNDWKISTGYYSLYFSLYSVLTGIGFRSENHTCTIVLMRHLLDGFFTPEECEMVERARQARVETQYYVAGDVSRAYAERLAQQVPRFLVKCRGIVDGLNEREVQALRERYRMLIEESGERW
ncbi:hypothetical protein E2N92_10310 [Methanofollis formosanus]|uniref:HEPN domain-containing protein n=1 Tax=Methanofollis formosanus TaxID=299308 RepID=A0A8G1A305_9EURY|nr:HEPN domain-containing protein [Methanofollis formosanus]QYZ79793.1 hypothetical protein E2N92_10310 [Methanofollis formosanus]